MKWVSLVGNLLAVAAVFFFIYLAVTASSAFQGISLNPLSASAMLLAMSVYVLAVATGAMGWFALLKSLGQKLTASTAIRLVFLSQAAKYIPGNVAHHVGRVVLARRQGFGLTATLFSIFLETLWVVAIAGMMASIALWMVGDQIFSDLPQVPAWWFLAGLVVLVLLAPLIGHRLFERVGGWWAERKGIAFRSIEMPTVGTFWLVSLLYVINYLILGAVVQIIATTIFNAQGGGILLLSGVFAVAWIVGFITPGAPAGLGVREVVLVAALAPIYGNEPAIGIAAVLRVVTVLGDGLAFLVGFGLGRWAAQPENAA